MGWVGCVRALSIVAGLWAVPLHAAADRPQADESWLSRLTGASEAAQLWSPEAKRRAAAAEALGRCGAVKPAIAALLEALEREQHSTVRRAVMEALVRRGRSSAVPGIVRALRRGPEASRPVAAWALGALGGELAAVPLIDALASDLTRAAASEALVRLGPPAVPALLRALDRPTIAAPVVRLLGRIGSPMAVPRLVPLLEQDQPALQAAAVRALGRIGDERATAAVAGLLDADSELLRERALEALGTIAGPPEVTLLAAEAGRGSLEHRRAALRALLRADPERGARALEAQAAGDDPTGVLAAVEVALDAPHPELVAVLYGILREGTRAAAAASVLAEMPAGEGVPVLVSELERNPTPAVQRGLAVALRRRWELVAKGDRAAALEALRATCPRSQARCRLLRALARDEDVLEVLERDLGAPEPRVRAAAGYGLSLFGESAEVSRKRLAAAVRQERHPEAFRRLATAAAKLGVELGPSELARHLAQPGTAPEALVLAARSLRAWAPDDRRAFRQRMRRELRSAVPRVRAAAARSLAIAGDRQAFRALVSRLDDPAPEVRRASGRALELLRVEAAEEVIAAAARVERDPQVRRALRDAARSSHRPALPRYEARGTEVLRVRIAARAGQRSGPLPVDVVLDDGRWLRLTTLPSGELFLAGLTSGHADVRVRVGGVEP